MYKKILLAVDGSEHSIRATDEVIKIASMSENCQTDIVLVADFAKAKQEVIHATGRAELDLIRRKRIEPVAKKLDEHQLPYEIHILHGDPGPTIVKHANEGDYDLLVIGSRGLNKLQVFVLGSVSHKVVKRANCPVMVVK